MSSMRRALSIAIHFAAGYLYAGLSLIAFLTVMTLESKLLLMACMLLLATGLLATGLMISRPDRPEFEAGIVLAVCAALGVLSVGSLFFMASFSPPPMRETFEEMDLQANFSDWVTGGLYLLTLSTTAMQLLKTSDP